MHKHLCVYISTYINTLLLYYFEETLNLLEQLRIRNTQMLILPLLTYSLVLLPGLCRSVSGLCNFPSL